MGRKITVFVLIFLLAFCFVALKGGENDDTLFLVEENIEKYNTDKKLEVNWKITEKEPKYDGVEINPGGNNMVISQQEKPEYDGVEIAETKSKNNTEVLVKYNDYNSETNFDSVELSQREVQISSRAGRARRLFGRASWYGPGFHGKVTASGEIFDQNAMTAAHKELKLGTLMRVTNLENGKSAVVTINDRGPYIEGRHLDVSRAAAQKLGMIEAGIVNVKMEILSTE
ncbi:MAG: septal ring lytic transglycosylase RlpA family protein [Tepidanaerobacteraceae bacterium]